MSLSDFPALVDTFPVIDAGAGDQLNTAGKEHDDFHNLLADAILAMQAKLGPDNSLSVNSHDFILDKTAKFVANRYRTGFNSDTDALQAAAAAALAAGGGEVWAYGPWTVEDRVEHGEAVNIRGAGSSQVGGATVFTLAHADAGIAFGANPAGSGGGVSGGFRINAGGLATVPMYCAVGTRAYMNIDIVNTPGSALLLEGAQNSFFCEVNVQGAQDCIKLDRGAGGNAFFKCEFGAATRYNCNIDCSSPTAPAPGTVNYPLHNTFEACIFEYSTATTLAMVRVAGGLGNMFSDCQMVSGHADTVLLDMSKATDAPFTIVKLRGSTLQFNVVDITTRAIAMSGLSILRASGGNEISNAHTIIKATGADCESRFFESPVVVGGTAWTELLSGALAHKHSYVPFEDIPATATTLGTVTKTIRLNDPFGNLIGYLPVYDTYS